MKIGNLITKLLVCLSLSTAVAAFGAAYTWTNGVGTKILNTAGNWNPAVTPSANNDLMVFDNTTNLGTLNWNASFGPGSSAGGGLNISYTGTNNLTFNCSVLTFPQFGLGNVTNASGAGVLTFGDGSTSNNIIFRNSTQTLVNNSTNAAVIMPFVYFGNGGGAGSRNITYDGTGNWLFTGSAFTTTFGAYAGAVLTKNGTGTMFLNNTNVHGGGTTLNAGTISLGIAQALGTGALTINGGNLDSSVVNLVNANNNAQNWNGNFGFIGTQNLNIGSGNVTMSANRIVTISNNTFEVDGAINGAGGLTKAGAGTLFLNNANNYSGGTTVSNGVVKLGLSGSITNVGNVTVHGTLDINGNSVTVNNLAGNSTGVIDTISGGTPSLTVSNTGSTTFSGVIKNTSGTLALTKVGSSTLTLSGANTYGGTTAVNAGTLLVNGGIGTGAVTVASGATNGGFGTIGGSVNWQSGSSALFTVTPTAAVSGSNSTPLTVSGSVALSGNSLTVNVAGGTPLTPGTYTLMAYNSSGSSGSFATGVPTYTGAGVQAGTASTVSTGSGKVTVTVILTGISATWTNNGNSVWSAVTNWSSNPSYPHIAGDGATLGVGSAYTTATLDAPVSLGLIAFTNANSFFVADSGSTLTFDNTGVGAAISVAAGSSNAIASVVALNDTLAVATAAGTSVAITNAVSNTSGAKTLTKSGAGTLVLSGNNTYGPASAGTVGTILAGGVLQLGKNSSAGAGDLSTTSSSTIQAGAAFTLANNIKAGSGATATVDDNGNNVTLSGVVSGAGALGKNGAGTLTLGSANTFSNGVSLSAGTLKLGNLAAIPSGTNFGNVNMGTNTTLDLNGFSAVLDGVNASVSSATIDSLTGGAVTLTMGANGAFATYLGTILNSSGTLALVKDGTGSQTLGGTNNITAGTTINAGTLQVGNGKTNSAGLGMAVGLGSGAVVNNGTLSFNLYGTNVFANTISSTGSVKVANSGLILELTGNNTSFTGDINVGNAGAAASGSLLINNVAGLGVGPKTITCANTASQIYLDGSAGDLNIADSSIAFYLSGSAGVLFNQAGNNTIAGTVGMVNGNGNPYIVVNNGTLTLAGGVTTVAGQNARALTLGGAGNGLVSGKITEAAPGSPQASITKQDAGTWTLSYAGNDYSGPTTVNGGTLIIDAAGFNIGTNAIAVNSGGTLLVNGANYGAGAVTVATNGTFGGVGTIYSAATFQAGAKGNFNTSASPTPMTVYGNIALNNNPMTVYVDGGTPLTPGIYPLLNIGNVALYSISGSFSSTPTITGAGIALGNVYFVTTSSSQVTLVVAASSTWTNNANGNWTTGANWNSNPNFPNAAGQVAILGFGSSLITVNLNASETVGGVSFTNNNSFVITNAANVLTLNNSGSGATISVAAGTANSIATGVSLNDATTVGTSAGASLTIPGSVSGGSALTKTGNGVLTLSGSNNGYSGVTTLGGGTLVLGSTNAIGSGTFTISGGSLDSSVPNLLNQNNNAQNWNGSLTFVGSQNLDLGSGAVMLGNNVTLGVNTNKLTVGGTISGAFTLTYGATNIVNSGTLELDGANGFTGFTIVSGTVSLGNDSALGAAAQIQLSPANVTPAATNLTIMSKDSTAHTITNGFSANGFDGPYIFGGTGDLTFSGTIATGNGYKRFFVINKTTISGLITDGGVPSGQVAKDGPGTLILTANNATTKPFRIDAGTLALGSTTAIGSGVLTINGGGLDSAVVNLVNANNNPQTWAGSFYFAGSQNLNLGTGSVAMSTNTTVTVSNNTLTVGGAVAGATRSLTKSGNGILVLSGANTYSNTTVTAGTLVIAQATLATNSSISISNGALLQLGFSVTNQVASFVSNGVSQAAGVYKSANSGGLITGTGALLVVPLAPAINPNPPVMQVSVLGSTMTLAWPTNAGWILQSNSVGLASSSAWFNYPANGAVDVTNLNITMNPAKTNVFFRMLKP